ncbi:MAG: GNAT family N-acetyltransferase, partial [Chitinophagaceae bacterium]
TSLHYSEQVSLELCLRNFREEYAAKLPTVSTAEFENFAELCRNSGSDFEIVIRGVKDDSGNVVATALMPLKHDRLYLLQSWVSQTGRSAKANHFLVDQIIREFAGTSLVLDFEGSDVPGIAAFYRNFGASDEPYYFLQWNNLPFMVRKIKEIKDGLRKSR